jgi:hypothetical protein
MNQSFTSNIDCPNQTRAKLEIQTTGSDPLADEVISTMNSDLSYSFQKFIEVSWPPVTK